MRCNAVGATRVDQSPYDSNICTSNAADRGVIHDTQLVFILKPCLILNQQPTMIHEAR
ncbi:hypothetical protein PLANPX_3260 [Lacipirellula parvula]|uniref:Uncharacterized protein n=1 Tax=Lacipirellula parvula TaxID=2650471 RepID=A0A5K7XAT2_9BACT|nr:hypothetical protein PLANPX_3260 [Lacipirellula parvula]